MNTKQVEPAMRMTVTIEGVVKGVSDYNQVKGYQSAMRFIALVRRSSHPEGINGGRVKWLNIEHAGKVLGEFRDGVWERNVPGWLVERVNQVIQALEALPS